MAITSREGLNQSKTSYLVFILEIDITDLRSLRSYSKYLMIRRRQRRARKGGSAEIHPCELMASWIYGEKLLMGM
jgi:hypothetical protein